MERTFRREIAFGGKSLRFLTERFWDFPSVLAAVIPRVF